MHPMRAERQRGRHKFDSKYLVSDEHRFVYFVIQKVACSSVKTALLPLFGLDAKVERFPERFQAAREDGTRVVLVHKLFDSSGLQIDRAELLAGEYGGHFKFAFVRNPWDRLVSCHSQKLAFIPKNPKFKQTDLNPPGEERFYPGMPFAEFVEAVHATPDEKANAHFKSQHTVVCDPQGEVMADFVGRFENLREDFARVAEKIGAPELQLPHLLRSKGRRDRSYTKFYDERLRNLVHERYREDIETFGYSFSAESAPASMDLRPSVARIYRERAHPEDGTRGLESRLQKCEGDLEVERGRTASLKKENRRLSRRARNREVQLEAMRASRIWRVVTSLGRLKARLKPGGSGKA